MEFLNNIQRVNGQPLTEQERNMIIYFLGRGEPAKEIARALSLDVRSIKKWSTRFLTTGLMKVPQRTGRPRITTSQEDWNILLSATEDPFRNLLQIREQTGIDISLQTYSRRLTENKLFCRVAKQRPQLTGPIRARRLQFAESYLEFQSWDRTLFVDESTFQSGAAYQELARRPRGCAYEDQYVQPINKSGRKSVSVFGIMTQNGLGPLVRIEGMFNSNRYLDILNQVVLPYAEENFGDNFYYYEDNSPVHKSNIVRQWSTLNFAPYQIIPTPPRSPDFNPIEHVWAKAKFRVADYGIYGSEDELWISIAEAWNELRFENNDFANNLVISMPRRLQESVNSNGSYTSY